MKYLLLNTRSSRSTNQCRNSHIPWNLHFLDEPGYLQSTKDYKMVFDGNDDNPVIYGWADSSFNTGVGDRKSQYGYCFGFGLKSAMFINVCRR